MSCQRTPWKPLLAPLAALLMAGCATAPPPQAAAPANDAAHSDELARQAEQIEALTERVDRLEAANQQPDERELSLIEQQLQRIEDRLEAQPPRRAPARRPRPDPQLTYAVAVGDAPTWGPDNAKVTVVKAFEFACPFCERSRATMDQIREEYGKDVRIVYKHYIVHHGQATIPAQAACAAGLQGKWRTMEQLIWEKGFKAGRNLSQDNMLKQAKRAGLRMKKFRADMNGACKEIVQNDQQQMAKVGVVGTPGFFINGRFLAGAQPFPAFKALIDEELAKANERIAEGTQQSRYYETWVVERGKDSL
ncbi:DsbA family protein [Haliangium ochraceum]|uniref:DSBA oxidoreductase n=1 Tax=Haliangium ochraceum (strain DSM 14365 / JCM 11303 / SMP-2) TaxID=502025 RepID=D0LY17_HALO1|nr:DsbA family protein [Haliangium ochraceum]ACY14372.1 DSBA oxidoreductase [Haliangium ochraceum DSM 14365]